MKNKYERWEPTPLKEWAEQNYLNLTDELLDNVDKWLREISTHNNIKDGERNWKQYLDEHKEDFPTQSTLEEMLEKDLPIQRILEEMLERRGRAEVVLDEIKHTGDINEINELAKELSDLEGDTHDIQDFIESVIEVRKEATETMGAGFTPVVMVIGRKKEYIVNNVIQRLRHDYGFDIKLDKNRNFDLLGVKVVIILLDDPMYKYSSRGLDSWYMYVDEDTELSIAEISELFKRLRGGKNPSTNYKYGVEKEMTKLGNVTFNEDGYVVKWTEALSPKRYIGKSGPEAMSGIEVNGVKFE